MPNTHMEINQLSSQGVRNENNSTTPSADQVCGLITPRGAAGAQTLPPLLRSNSTAHVDTTPVERADPVILLPSPARVRRSEMQTKLPNPPAHHITSHEDAQPRATPTPAPRKNRARAAATGLWGLGTRLGVGGQGSGVGGEQEGQEANCVGVCGCVYKPRRKPLASTEGWWHMAWPVHSVPTGKDSPSQARVIVLR